MDVDVMMLDICIFFDLMGEGKIVKLLHLKVEEVAVVYPFFYAKGRRRWWNLCSGGD